MGYLGFVRERALGLEPDGEIFPAVLEEASGLPKHDGSFSGDEESDFKDANIQGRVADQHQRRESDS